MKTIKKAVVLAVVSFAVFSLTACTDKAGAPCSIPGAASKDDQGHDLFCGNNQAGKRVWNRV